MADLSFCTLREKVVINVCDGKRLGHIIDINFNSHGQILGMIVPGDRKFMKSLSAGDSIYIPWRCIVKIGEDTILVELKGEIPPSSCGKICSGNCR